MIIASVFRFSRPDQVLVDLLSGADVRMDGVFILTELSSETQVFENAKQEFFPLLSTNRIVVLRVLLLQHLEDNRERLGVTPPGQKLIGRGSLRQTGGGEEADLSELIIVRVDIMKAFDDMSRGPQDPTGVERVKKLHGDLCAWHRLHIHGHHWPVYSKYTHTVRVGGRLKHSTENCLPMSSR